MLPSSVPTFASLFVRIHGVSGSNPFVFLQIRSILLIVFSFQWVSLSFSVTNKNRKVNLKRVSYIFRMNSLHNSPVFIFIYCRYQRVVAKSITLQISHSAVINCLSLCFVKYSSCLKLMRHWNFHGDEYSTHDFWVALPRSVVVGHRRFVRPCCHRPPKLRYHITTLQPEDIDLIS
jgi:hypothetical protein